MMVAVQPTGSLRKYTGAIVSREPMPVVIDDFQNFCVFDVFDRLTALIVID